MTINDWRMDAMAEFFNVEFVRIGEDGEPMSSDTTRTPAGRVEAILCDYAAGYIDDRTESDLAEEIIALVRAAAWREFSEAMLADETLNAACRNMFDQLEEAPEITWEYVCKELTEHAEEAMLAMKENASALLAAIAPEEASDE